MAKEGAIADRWLVITNPTAGKRRLAGQSKYVTSELRNHGYDFHFEKTAYSGHAIELARHHAQLGCRNFIILGGDGTISEVVNGLFSSGEDTTTMRLALIPRGTGNDWARFWGLKRNDEKSMQIFLRGKTKTIDIGEISYQEFDIDKKYYFINSVGFGLDAKIVHITNKLKKIFGGHSFLYTVSFLLALINFKKFNLKVSLDGNKETSSLITMNIANGPYSGGGIRQNPSAIPFDGIFDMNIVSNIQFKDIVKVIPNLFNGKIDRAKAVRLYKAKKIEIDTEAEAMVEADGIMVPHANKCTVQLIPQAIQMIVP